MIRPIQQEDIPQCVSVIRTSFSTVAKQFGVTAENSPQFTCYVTTLERITSQFQDPSRELFGYFLDDKLVGYFHLHFLEDGNCELNNFCILPDYRHHKLGDQLLNYAFDIARQHKCPKMLIEMIAENIVLRKWYENYGFIYLKTTKFDIFPFNSGLMEKSLQLQ